MGLGSGITLATAARFPLAQIDCVEIADSVLRAADFFAPDNALGEAAGRVRILSGDARVFLARHPRAYDVVVANTLHPWSVGSTGLYSAEYFARLAGALRPGGIAAQWLPVERIGAESLAAILRTFYQVFPDGALWWGAGNLIALGSQAPIATPERVGSARETGGEPARAGADRLPLIRPSFAPAGSRAPRRCGPGWAPGRSCRTIAPCSKRAQRAVRRTTTPAASGACWSASRTRRRASGGSAPAARAFLQALAARETDDLARAQALEAEAASHGLARAVARVQAQSWIEQGYRALEEGRLDAAANAFRSALEVDPDQRDARYGLAGAAMLEGRRAEAIEELRALVERFPADAAAHNQLSGLLAYTGDREGARKAAQRALDANPFYPEALANAGLLAARAGDLDTARRMLERLRAVTPFGVSREEIALREALADAERRGAGRTSPG